MKIEFFNREKEKQEIMDVLESEPQLINFIYGPINSGKTTLITKLIEDLPKDKYVVFYINLRGKLIKEYGGFARVLFKVKKKEISEKAGEKGERIAKKAIVLAGRYLSGIPIEKDILDEFLETKGTEDVFEFLEGYFLKISEEKTPIFIIDELQVIGDLEINGKAIYKLFNFFIRLTKELHLCHVFALSSDSLFIEKVYSEAMLQGRCSYMLVDDFDEQTSRKFLEKYRISKEEQNIAWNNLGGKPLSLREFVFSKDRKEYINDEISLRKGQIETTLKKVKELNVKIMIDKDEWDVKYENLMSVLKKLEKKDTISIRECDEISKAFFVNKNILFVDPKKNIIKPQSKLDFIAIREILEEIK